MNFQNPKSNIPQYKQLAIKTEQQQEISTLPNCENSPIIQISNFVGTEWKWERKKKKKNNQSHRYWILLSIDDQKTKTDQQQETPEHSKSESQSSNANL